MILFFSINVIAQYQDINVSVLDYETMNPVNQSIVSAYDGISLIDSCTTNASGFCNLSLENGSHTFLVSASGYETGNFEDNVSGDTSFIFKIRSLESASVLTIHINDYGSGMALCFNNMTECFNSNETISLTVRQDYTMILIPEDHDLTDYGFLTNIASDVILVVFSIALILTIAMGLMYGLKSVVKRY